MFWCVYYFTSDLIVKLRPWPGKDRPPLAAPRFSCYKQVCNLKSLFFESPLDFLTLNTKAKPARRHVMVASSLFSEK